MADTPAEHQLSTSLWFCTLLAAGELKVSRKDHSVIKRGKTITLTCSFQSCLLQFHPRELPQQLNLNSATTRRHDTNFPHCLHVTTPSEPLAQPKLVVFASMYHQQSYFLIAIVLRLDLPQRCLLHIHQQEQTAVLGQTARGLMLARNPTSPGFGTFVCSLNRQNISLDWHGCGGIEGRAVTPQPHLLLVDRERRCPQGMLPVPLQRADLHE